MITRDRHNDTKILLDILEGDIRVTSYQREAMITIYNEVKAQYEYEQAWRKKITERLNRA